MPLIKIELIKGLEKESIIKIMSLVMDAVVESLKLRDDDRNIRLSEYESDFFNMKSPYKVLIEITMFKGRTKETKKLLYQNIVNSLFINKLYNKDEIFIVLNEQVLENWGVRGGVSADEIKLNFNVNI